MLLPLQRIEKDESRLMAMEMIKRSEAEKDSEDIQSTDNSPSWCGLNGDQMREAKTELKSLGNI